MSTHPHLTDALEKKILIWIRSGVFPHIAAEAEGIPLEVFQKWLALGTRKTPRPIHRYRLFASRIQQAAGIGRIRAEIALREKDPKTWLLSGPGRDRAECPGWSSAARPAPGRKEGAGDSDAAAQLAALIDVLLTALDRFPEARNAAAEALSEVSGEGTKK